MVEPGAREQSAEIGVARLCFGQQRQVAAIGQRDLGPDDGVKIGLGRGAPKTDRPGQRMVVGQRQTVQANFLGAGHQRLGRRGSVEEGKVAVAMELGIATPPPNLPQLGGETVTGYLINHRLCSASNFRLLNREKAHRADRGWW